MCATSKNLKLKDNGHEYDDPKIPHVKTEWSDEHQLSQDDKQIREGPPVSWLIKQADLWFQGRAEIPIEQLCSHMKYALLRASSSMVRANGS